MENSQARLQRDTSQPVVQLARALADQYEGDGRHPDRITIEDGGGGFYLIKVYTRDRKDFEFVSVTAGPEA